MTQSLRLKPSRLIGTIIAAAYFYYCVTNPTLGHFIDNIDLIIHEAGHLIFIFFGEFMNILGGSVLQILVPIIFCLYFFVYKQEFFSGSILLFWVGFNFVNVSIYMGDAILMNLPLLGGDGVIHDWNYLLSQIGVLAKTATLADVTYNIGVFILVAAAIFSARFSFIENKNVLV